MGNIFANSQALSGKDLSERRRRAFLILIGVTAITVVIALAVIIIKKIPPTRIILNYAPSSATVTINGKEIFDSTLDLSPGTYDIEVKKFGFETFTTTVDLGLFKTETIFAILEPSMYFTENWYAKNPEDTTILDGQVSYSYDDAVEQMVTEFPVTKKLPIKQANFNIYYGVCGDGNCQIVIEADEKQYDAAVQYFYRHLDSDLGKYNFGFINYGNKFQGERNGFGT